MSSQTVVDVVISGTTATVVDSRIDGITTVAGAPPITNVSGQIPDLGVTTSYLAGQGEILSLINDVANLRANVIITGQTLTDEIGVVSGTLISTGNYLESNILTLSGDLIASGNNLDSLRDILSGNLITTGRVLEGQIQNSTIDISALQTATGTLQDQKFDKAGGTLSGNVTPSSSGTLSLGTADFPFKSGFFEDLTVSNNTLYVGEIAITATDAGGLDFESASGTTFFKDVSIRNLTVTGTETIIDVDNLAIKDNKIILNSGESGAGISLVTGGIIIDRGTLTDADLLFNEANDRFEFNFPLALEGNLAVTANQTGTYADAGNLITTGQTLTSEINIVSGLIIDNDGDITSLKTATGVLKTFTDDNAANLITTGQTLTTNINTVSTNLIATGSVVDDISGNLTTTGQTLTSEIGTVSGLITDNDGDITALKTATGVLKTSTDANTSNLITTGNFLTSEINIVSGLAGGSVIDELSGNLITTGQTLQVQITSNDSDISTLTSNLVTTGQTLTSEIATVSGIAEAHTDVTALSGKVDDISGNLIITGRTLTTDINTVSANLISTGAIIDDVSGNLITTGQTLQTQITSNDGDISTLTSNLITTGQTLTSEIIIVSGLTTGSASDPALSGKVDTLSGNLITTGQTLQTQITSNDSDISTLTSNLITTGQTLTTDINTVSTSLISTGAVVDDISGNLITTGQTLQTQITSNDSDISTLTSNLISTGSVVDDISGNLITTGQTLTTSINTNSSNLITTGQTLTSEIAIVSGIAEAHTDVSALSGKVDDISGNLITTGQTLQTQITSNDTDISNLTANLISTGTIVDDISGNLITTGQTLQTQITSNDGDLTTLTSNLITTGQTLTSEIGTVSGLITDNDAEITALLAATGELKTDTNTNASNLITTGQTLTTNINTVSTNLVSTGSVVDDISGNLITTGQTLQTQITSNDGDISTLTSNLITTGQTLQTQITSNDSDISTLTSNLISTGSVVDDISGNLITTGQTLQTQITSNDSDISTLTSNLVTTGQTLTTNINTVSSNLVSTGSVVDDISGNLITTGQTLQTQITSNDGDISTLTTNLGTTGQTLQTQITSNDADIATLDSTTVKLTTNQSVAGNKIFTDTVTINNLTVTGTEVIVDVENLAVKDNIIHINSGESGAGISRISGGITIDRGTEPAANILYNDANDRFELNFPLATEGNVVASAANLITTGQTLQTQITSNDGDITTLTTNLGTTGQTLQTQITSNDSDISTLTSNLSTTNSNLVTTGQTLTTNINTVSTNLVSTGSIVDDISGNLITTGQTLQTQITSNDTDITNLSSNLVTTGQTLTTNINTVANNLVTTGQTLTSEIATVSGLIPATVIDGGGTANKVPLWSDANTIGDSVISQSSSKIGIGTATPSAPLHVAVDGTSEILLERTTNITGMPSQIRIKSVGSEWSLANNLAGNGKFSIRDVTDSRHVMVFDGEGVVTTNKLEPLNGNDTGYLGSSSKKWKEVYFGILEADTATFSGALNFNNGSDNCLRIEADAGKDAYINSYGSGNFIQFKQNSAAVLSLYETFLAIPDSTQLRFGGGSDLRFYHDGNNSYIWQVGVGALNIKSSVTDGNIVFTADRGDGGGTFDYFSVNGGDTTYAGGVTTAYTKWPDNSRIALGGGKDLQLYHDGSNSHIKNTGSLYVASETSGDLYLRSDDDIFIQPQGGENGITLTGNGAVTLYYDNAVKLATVSTGITVTGAGTFSTSLKAATILDASNSAGTSGQILTSTGSALDWKTLGEISGVDGTGTAGYLSKWTDADTIGNSVIVESSSKIGIGTATPEVPLEVVFSRGAKTSLTDIWGLRSENTGDVAGTQAGLTFIVNNASSARAWAGIYAEQTNTDDTSLKFWNEKANSRTVKMTINSDGNVGIGSENPAYKLDVRGDYIFVDDGKGIRFGGSSHQVTRETGNELRLKAANTTGFITFLTGGGTEYMRIAADGKVGIGTNAPTSKLHTYVTADHNYLTIENSTANQAALQWKTSTTNADWIAYIPTSSSDLRLYSGGDLVTFKTDGKVGIGTSPVYAFEVVAGTNEVVFEHDTHANGTQTIKFNPSSTKAGGISKIYSSYAGTGATEGKLALGTYSAQTALTIDNGGRVGINNTSPSNRFEVSGTSKFTGNVNIGAAGAGWDALFQSTTSGQYWEWDASMSLTRYRDNTKAVFGNGDDLEIYHDGSHSYIKDTGTGNLVLATSRLSINNAASNEEMISAIQNGAVELFYANSKKLETTSTGVTVTGGVVATSTIQVSRSSASPLFQVTDADAGGGAKSRWFGLVDGTSRFAIYGTNGSTEEFKLDDGGAATFSGALEASSGKFTTTNNQLTIFSSGTQYGYWNQNIVGFKNAAGVVRTDGPSDLKLQTNSTDRLTIHGSTGAVGIGISAPDVRFHVETSVADVLSKFINTDGTNGHGLLVKAGGSASGKYIATFRDAANNTRMHLLADGKVGIGTAAPSAPLHVNETNTTAEAATVGRFSTTSGGAFKLMVDDKSAANPKWGIETGGGEAIEIRPASVSSIFCATDGKVGIGTTAPSNNLEVTASADNKGITIGSSSGNVRVLDFARTTTHANPTARIKVTEPGATHTSDMRFYTSDASGSAPNLVERLRIKSDGKVGIGTTAPDSLLQIANANGSSYRFGYGGTSDVYFDADDVYFRSDNGGVNNMLLKGSKLGIGTTAPGETLDVNGKIQIRGGNWLIFRNSNNSNYGSMRGASDTSNDVTINTNGEVIRFKQDGKVGIGTATPDAHKLTVVGGDDAEGTVHFHQNVATNNPTLYIQQVGEGGNAGNTTGLLIKCDGQNGGLSHLIRAIGTNSNVNSGTDVDAFAVRNDGKIGIGTTAPLSLLDVFFTSSRRLLANYDDSLITLKASNNSSNPENLRLVADDIIFNTGTSGSGSERMRITDAGKVGIGTTAPAKPVHVNVETGWATLRLEGASDSGGEIEFYKSSTKSGSIFFSAAGDCQIRPLGVAEKFIILANGKVGIGNTPKSWSTLFDVLQIGYSGALAGRQGDSSNQMDVMNNVYYDGAFKRINAGYASRFTQNHVGDFEFFTAGTAAADSSISFTESMTILNDGTLDLKSAKLKINGSAGSSGQTLTTDGSGNISWSSAGSGTISGSGTDNYVPRFNGTTALQNSAIFSNDSGSVGIGCADPTSRLTVEKTSTATTLSKDGTVLMLRGADGANKYSHIGFTYDIAGDVQPSSTIGIQLTSWTASTKSDLVFGTRDVTTDTAPTERMRITSAGKVGIGTNAPSVHLDVYTAVGWGVVDIDGASGGELRFQKAGTTWLDIYGNDSSYAVLKATSHLSIYVNGSTLAAYFKSDGKVGIGTNAPNGSLDVVATGDATNPTIQVGYSTGSRANYRFGLYSDSEAGYISNKNGNNGIRFLHRGATVMQVGYGGDATTPYVGIGTTAPEQRLHVSSAANQIRIQDSGSSKKFDLNVDGTAFFIDDMTAGVNRFTINTGGDVGIGTTSPSRLFNVYSGSDDTAWIRATYGTTTSVEIGAHSAAAYLSSGTGDDIRISPAGSTRLIIKVDGKIGIGTIAPDNILHVYSSASAMIKLQSAAGNNDIGIDFYRGTDLKWEIRNNGNDDSLFFIPQGQNDADTKLAIKSDGNVGIGTTAPAATLHTFVSGGPNEFRMQAHRNDVGQNMFSTYFSRGTSASPTIVQNGDTLLEIQPKGYDGANYHRAAEIDFQVDGTPGTNDMPGRIMFWTTADGASAPTERMRITSTGNVGIGTTSPAEILTLDSSSNTRLLIRESGSNKGQISAGGGGLYIQNLAGDIIFRNISDADTVRIKNDGKVGIGTTAPAYRLEVKASVTGDWLSRIYNTATTSNPSGLLVRIDDADSTGTILGVNNAGNYHMVVKGDGKVGIGTSAPAYALDVRSAGATTLQVKSAGNSDDTQLKLQSNAFFFNITNEGASGNITYISDDAQDQIWYTDNASNSSVERFRIKGGADTDSIYFSNSKVGIGTAAPAAKLHAYRNDNGAWAAQFDNVHATGWGALIRGGADSGDYSLLVRDYNQNDLFTIRGNGNVGIGTNGPDAPLHVARASDYKVIKLGDDITSHYVMTGNSDHTLTLTCGSYYQAEIIVTAHQTNGGTYNNLYIRGIWSNNDTSHHWDEIENVGSLTNSTFTITNGQNGATTNSGEWKIVHDYVSGTFVKFTVRVTDFYGTHAYTIS